MSAAPVGPLNPLIPRAIDLPTTVPLGREADLRILDGAKILAAPDDPEDWPRWRQQITRWRDEARTRMGNYTPRYDEAAGSWASRCHVIAQVWLWDELLYDAANQQFTPDKLLCDAEERFGGFDAIVLWHAYPVIGIDERNQWDYYRQIPGLRELVDDLHQRGVRVFCDYNPWDTGTRRGDDDATELARLITDFAFDGVFLDTLKKADHHLTQALFAVNKGLALETESKLPLEDVATHTISWAQWFADSRTPGVLKTHLFEPRHMQHHIRRWNRDHSEELQSAWLNGAGIMVWEVVFSAWVGWCERDAATLRRMRPVQYHWPELLVDGRYEPLTYLTRTAHESGIYASTWRDQDRTLLALINRSDHDVALHAADLAHVIGPDALSLTPGPRGSICVPARSIGGLVTGPGADAIAAASRAVPTACSARHPYRDPHRSDSPHTPHRTPDPRWIEVPAQKHHLTVRYLCRETGLYGEAPFVEEWKPLHPRLHDLRTREIQYSTEKLWVSPEDVTLGQFTDFVNATGYAWDTHQQRDPTSAVRWVDLDDARTYCAWAGLRLPNEYEWQLALSARPQQSEVALWNWTDSEHSDGRSRFTILKGGSDCDVHGSEWYVPAGRRGADFSLKFLRQGFHLDRNAWTSFRVAHD